MKHCFLAVCLLALTAASLAAQPATTLVSQRDTSLPVTAGGNGDSVAPVISTDGRFVLFSSSASDLVPGDNGQLGMDVFLRDRTSNATVVVSANYLGTGGGNGSSTLGLLSTNGRFVVFESDATDLVPGDTNNATDLFVRDLEKATNRLVSVAVDGSSANGASSSAAITPDGRYVAFVSTATNLVPGDVNKLPDVFVRDLVNGTNVLVSTGASGTTFLGSVETTVASPAITPDGRYVAFFDAFKGLVPGVPSGSQGEVYVRDLVSGTTTWASTNAAALAVSALGSAYASAPSYHPVLSDDGRFVLFKTGGADRVKPALILRFDTVTRSTVVIDTNAVSMSPYSDDVYGPEATPDGRFVAYARRESTTANYCSLRLWDAQTGSNVLISCDTNGLVPPGTVSSTPVLSPDGRFVVFLSNAGSLVTNVLSTGFHLYRRDLQSGTTELADADPVGAGTIDCQRTVPSLSADGRFVAFSGPDGDLVAGDSNKAYDVFLRDMDQESTGLVSRRDPGVALTAGDALSSATQLSISDDGRWVVYSSSADDLVPGDTNFAEDVFVRDRATGSNILVSAGMNGGPALGGFSYCGTISGDGRYVVFLSTATNLVTGLASGFLNLYRRDLLSQTTLLVSVGYNGWWSSGNGDCTVPVISEDGRYIAFLSKARNLAPSLTGYGPNTFWRDMNRGTNMSLPNPAQSTVSSNPPSMSADGRYVAYFRSPSQLWVWDSQQSTDVYSNLASVASAAISPTGLRVLYQVSGNLYADDIATGSNLFAVPSAVPIESAAQWSADGRWFAFVTASNLVAGDVNGVNDIYLYDLQTRTLTLVSFSADGAAAADGRSDSPVLSGNGRFVVYRSFATDLVAGGAQASPDIFLFDRFTGSNTLITADQSGLNWFTWASKPAVSQNGQAIAFESWGAGLVSGDQNRVQDVFGAAVDMSASVDSDGDGIPDWWMIEHFGHATGEAGDLSLAQDDADGDGMSNLQEFLTGTDPRDPTSVFRLQLSWDASGNDTKLIWNAIPGRGYQVEYKDRLDDPSWLVLPGTASVLGNEGMFNIPGNQPARFYRVELVN